MTADMWAAVILFTSGALFGALVCGLIETLLPGRHRR
jgi:hypothetical protein